MAERFRHVAIVGKHQAPGIRPVLEEIAQFLCSHGLDVSLEADTALNTGLTGYDALSHDELGRACDLVVVIGHNDAPAVPGAGSAVFLHLARADWGPTEGCIAFRRDDLTAILAEVTSNDWIDIRAL